MSEQDSRLAVDAKGYVWRVFEDAWSMAPSNPDNSPIPEPVRYYVPQEENDRLREALKRVMRSQAALVEFLEMDDEHPHGKELVASRDQAKDALGMSHG